jgi:hypothetical protein
MINQATATNLTDFENLSGLNHMEISPPIRFPPTQRFHKGQV